MDFSSDGSLLAAGYGNILCIYCSETLQLKCALNSPSGLDGIGNKLIINLPVNEMQKPWDEKKNFIEEKKKIFQNIKTFLEKSDDKKLLNDLIHSLSTSTKPDPHKIENLLLNEQENIFKRIMAMNDLNFYHKLQLFRKLNIHCKSSMEIEQQFKKYISQNLSICNTLKEDLMHRSKLLNENYKFLAMRNLNQIKSIASDEKWLPKVCRFGSDYDLFFANFISNEIKTAELFGIHKKIQCTAQISHIGFGTGDHSHLVSSKIVLMHIKC